MWQRIFDGALAGSGETRRFCRRLRRWVLKRADPMVVWELNGRKLRLPLSHQLPFYRQEFPTYSANLQRLACAIRQRYGNLVMIDVGANIGDSLALAGARPEDACLLIEGDAGYFQMLQRNTADLPGAICVAAMLSDRTGKEAVQLVSGGGTGQIVSGDREGAGTRLRTLDSILDEQTQFRGARLLKVDVDGYDFRVLRGGAQLIRAAHPVLFFEQDPRLLEGAGENPDALWAWLAEMGYAQVLLYDNIGYWLGCYSLDRQQELSQLNGYAKQRGGYYYDVAAFAPTHDSLLTDFQREERAYYAVLSGRS